MIRTIDIRVHAERPDFPLCEAVAFVGAPVAVRISNTPRKVGMWEITSVAASIVWPDNSIASVECTREGDAWVGTLQGSSTSGRTTGGFQITASGTSETGETVEGYVLGVGNVCVMNRDMTITVGGVTYYMHLLDSAPETPHKGDVASIGEVLKFYNGTAWAAFDERAYVAAMLAQQKADSAYVRAGSAEEKAIRAQDTADDARNVAQRAEVDAVSHAANTTVHVTAAEKATWNGKQSALSAQQLANIAAVSNALAFDATHSYAAGDPVVYNGTLYTFTATHTGAWTGSDVSAVDIIARLAGKLGNSGNQSLDGQLIVNKKLSIHSMDGDWPSYPVELDTEYSSGVANLVIKVGDGQTMRTYRLPLPDWEHGQYYLDGIFALAAANPTAGNLAALDASGNPTDSGYRFEVRNGVPYIIETTND